MLKFQKMAYKRKCLKKWTTAMFHDYFIIIFHNYVLNFDNFGQKLFEILA